MNRRKFVFVLIALACVLVVLGAVSPGKVVNAAIPAYRLESGTFQSVQISSGGHYQVIHAISPSGTGTPCCCVHLPCLRK